MQLNSYEKSWRLITPGAIRRQEFYLLCCRSWQLTPFQIFCHRRVIILKDMGSMQWSVSQKVVEIQWWSSRKELFHQLRADRKENLRVNPSKVILIPLTRNVSDINFLQRYFPGANEVKYLGLVIDSKLTWNLYLRSNMKKNNKKQNICLKFILTFYHVTLIQF